MTGGKGGNGGNLQSFGNSGLFDDGATRRKPAETGGNPVQRLCSGNRSWFGCLTQGVHARRISGRTYAHRLRKLRKPSVRSVDRRRTLVAIGPAHVGRQGEGDLAVVMARRRTKLEGLQSLPAQFDVVHR